MSQESMFGTISYALLCFRISSNVELVNLALTEWYITSEAIHLNMDLNKCNSWSLRPSFTFIQSLASDRKKPFNLWFISPILIMLDIVHFIRYIQYMYTPWELPLLLTSDDCCYYTDRNFIFSGSNLIVVE